MPALSRGTADRSEDLRDPDRILRAWPSAVVLGVDEEGRLDADDGATDGSAIEDGGVALPARG